MSTRAIEFVENWVEQKIEREGLPAPGEDSPGKQWAAECVAAASADGILQSELDEVFDDLAAFIDGQIEEAEDRVKDEGANDDDDEDGNGDDESDANDGHQ